jgi:glycosyltransferase involved in cell wall biosynthesis
VWQQQVLPLEVIVVDDHSTDDTVAIAVANGAKVIALQDGRGPAAGRNRGVQHAQAQLVAFVDADDEWYPQHTRVLLDAMAQTGAMFVSSAHELFGTASGIECAPLPAATRLDMRSRIFADNPISQSGVMVPRSEILAIGGYDESLVMSEDYEFWIRLVTRGDFAYNPTVTVRRRVHPRQLTHANHAKLISGAWHARRSGLAFRAAHALPLDSTEILTHLLVAAERDLRNALRAGDALALQTLRAELQATDALLQDEAVLGAIAGTGHALRTVAQDVICSARRLLRRVRGR